VLDCVCLCVPNPLKVTNVRLQYQLFPALNPRHSLKEEGGWDNNYGSGLEEEKEGKKGEKRGGRGKENDRTSWPTQDLGLNLLCSTD
jgi:hypothetical protein